MFNVNDEKRFILKKTENLIVVGIILISKQMKKYFSNMEVNVKRN
jgi:hypothetical protein